MRRRILVTSVAAVAALSTIVTVGAVHSAWAGSSRHSNHGRSGRVPVTPSASPSASARASNPASPSGSVLPSSSRSVPESTSPSATSGPRSGRVFFDDFSYASSNDTALSGHGWSVRTGSGAPGVSGASWSKNAVTFVDDPTMAGNKIMRLSASTTGTGSGTVQAEVNTTANKFFTGTYAARVYFNDTPASGPDGDAINQTFFTITPLRYDDDPIYSELDFEYLPNGGWGASVPTMYLTSWYTYHNSPSWGGDRVSGEVGRSLQGWHDLVIQTLGGTVTYYIDGAKVFTSTGKYYPRQNMSINFNEWFIEGGLLGGSTSRTYRQQVDWVYHIADQALSPAEVSAQISAHRTAGISFQDRV